MEKSFTNFSYTVMSLALVTGVLMVAMTVHPANGQTDSICTGPMIRNLGSCMSFSISGSNLSRPSSDCCQSLRELMSSGQDCLCLIVTGGVPFEVPIDRNIAMSLPRACRMSGVAMQCKGVPRQGGPTTFFGLSPPSPTAPSGGGMIVPGGDDLIPTMAPPGMRPTLTPSAAQPSRSALSSFFVAFVGVLLLKCYNY